MFGYCLVCTRPSGFTEVFPALFPTLEDNLKYCKRDFSGFTKVELKTISIQ